MGYDFHITRAEDWAESEQIPILRDEWEAVASGRPDLLHTGQVRWIDEGEQDVYGMKNEEASFSWRHGRVVITGRVSDEVWATAEAIAHELNARLIGDDE